MGSQKKNIAILVESGYERPYKLIDGVLSIPGLRDRCAFRSFEVYEVAHEDVFTEDWKPDGILVQYDERHPAAEWIKNVEVPVVNMAFLPERIHPSVGTDPESLVKAVVEHFGAIECQEILYAGTVDSELAMTNFRMLQALCEMKHFKCHYIEMDEQLGCKDVAHFDERYPDLLGVMQGAEGKLGIWAYHDLRGRLLVDYAQARGFSVPSQVAVLGVFDSVVAKLCDPPLSSVMLNDMVIGAMSIELLLDLIHGKTIVDKHKKIPVMGVRVRGSTVGGDSVDMEVLKARNIIRERAGQGVTVEQVVECLSVSRSTFEKRFSELTGSSPAQEIRKVRLEIAKEYLVHTDLPLARIAPMVGFLGRRAFMVFFKREAGMTPGEYRSLQK